MNARVRAFHHRLRALRMTGQQLPAVGAFESKQIRIIIPSAPFDEPIIGRSCFQRVSDHLRTELRQLREATGPAKREPPSIRTAPEIVIGSKKAALVPLHIVAVGADETHCTAPVGKVDGPWIEGLHAGRGMTIRAGHQDRQVHAPVSRCLNMSVDARQTRRLEFITAGPAENRREGFQPLHGRCRRFVQSKERQRHPCAMARSRQLGICGSCMQIRRRLNLSR